METLEQIKLRYAAFTEGKSITPMSPKGVEWLIEVAEAAKHTRDMIRFCNGRPVDETLAILLDDVFSE